MAAGRVHAIGVPTMRALLRWELVEDVTGAPQVTVLGLEVLDETPGGPGVPTSAL
jgi:hypothetical protein